MCIIIAKDKKSRLPKEEELKNSFEYNSDGAGFMYVDNGKVVIDKGYMEYDDFINHYRKLLKKYNNFKNKSLVIHCRIGTSGKNNKGNTHPYPITNNERLLHKKYTKQDIGIVHNGIIHGYGTKKGLNDTQEYIIKFLYPLYSNYKDFYKNDDIRDCIERMTSSKFAILDKNDDVYYIGDFVEDDGLMFSNDTYKSFTKYFYQYPSRYYDDWYELKKEEQDLYDEMEDEEYMIPLDRSWYIDLYGNGNLSLVGDKDYWFDYETLDLYELRDEKYHLIARSPYIYDESWEMIY